jgi:hypothetical protein
LVAPVAGLLLLRAPLISALPQPYRDPWFYSGYGWTLSHHVEIFGWFYYADRFTAILPISWSTALFGPVVGYIVLRYIILTATGALLYRCVRRFASVGVSCASVLLLALNPFYLRMVLWDYTTFVSLPCTIAGVAVWHLGSSRRQSLWTAAASGGFISAAVFANPLSGLVIPALFGVEGISAVRRRQSLAFPARLGAALAAAIAVFAGGYLSYRAYLGSFSPWDLIRPTLEVAQYGQLAAPFQHSPSLWLKIEPRIYAPVLVCVAVVVVLGRALLADTRRARLAQFAVAYTALFWIYRFAVTGGVIETWWAYNMTAVTGAFGLPVILDELVRRTEARKRAVLLAAAVVAVGLVDLVIRSLGSTAVSFYHYLRWHPAALLSLVLATCVVVFALSLTRVASLRLAALVALFGLIALIALTPAYYLGIQQTGEFSPYGSAEVDAYQAGYNMTRLVAAYDRAPSRVLLWTSLYGLAQIGWANLPHAEGGIENPEMPIRLPRLTPSEVEMLTYPTTTRILAISDSSAEVASAGPALAAVGLKPMRVQAGSWGDGKLHYELIGIHIAR